MSLSYRAIDWNRQKRLYDLSLGGVLVLAVGGFIVLSLLRSPEITAETLVLRATALAAFLLLHVILAIGPLCRLAPRFLPLLYNRRHLGVTFFLLALVHATVAVVQFHALGDTFPLVSIFTAYAQDYAPLRLGASNLAHFPFEPFGAIALVVALFMAATSHDFWLRLLGHRLWKSLHLGAYPAYGLLLAHVAFGALQTEPHPLLAFLVLTGFTALAGLHLAAAHRESAFDRLSDKWITEEFQRAGRLTDLLPANGHGRVVTLAGQRLALFHHDGRLFATSNVCRHQGGPLGEGRILDGCITCPWHGWNYQPEDGCSPPPFTERIDTHEVRVLDGWVWIRTKPHPTGTRSTGCTVACDINPKDSNGTGHPSPTHP